VCPIFIIFSELIHIQGHLESIRGVTKLRNKIYVLKKHRYALLNTVILVFEDRTPFRHLKNIKIKRVKSVFDIGSNEKENCFYVADGHERCVWKITKGADDKYNMIKWVTTDYVLRQNTLSGCAISVSSVGNSLVVCKFLTNLKIYRSDAEHRSIKLPRSTKYPVHAVET